MKYRIFIAINLPKDTKQKIALFSQNLKRFNWPVKWVELENFDITLNFLGDLTPKEVEKVCLILEKTTKNYHPFDLKIERLNVFPNLAHVRTVIFEVEKNDELMKLQQELSSRLKVNEFRVEERKFTPHITLGRVKRKRLRLDENLLNNLSVPQSVFTVQNIEIMKSELFPEGPKYSIVKSYKLCSQ